MTNDRTLLIFALEQESQNVFADYKVLHTGVGKINAAYSLSRHLHEHRPELVVNLGTAGSRKHPRGSIINPTKFAQRDMGVTFLGFDKFHPPFSDDPVILEYGQSITGAIPGVCGTGDNFDTSLSATAFDVVDMEAYALALICKREAIPFLCLKYVSDGADENSGKDWNQALRDTARILETTLKEANL